MEQQERDFKGIWIPKKIWLNENLTLIEKCMLAEIDSLNNDDNGCFASNAYFAKFFGVSKDRISKVLTSLVRKGFIINKIIYKEGSKKIDKRILKNIPIGKNNYTYNGKHLEGIGKNAEDITKRYNIVDNTINNKSNDLLFIDSNTKNFEKNFKKETKEEHSQKSESNKNYIAAIGQSSKTFLDLFKSEITESFIEMLKMKYKLTSEEIKEIANNFILYRTEQNLKGTKQKRQMEKTFDVKRRFYTRLNNEQKYNKRPQDTTGVVIIG